MPVWLPRVLKTIGVIAGLGLLFAWFGVYETVRLPFGVRFLYWSSTMAVGFGSSFLITPLVFERLLPNQPQSLQIFATAALIALPVVCSLFLVNYIAYGEQIRLGELPIQYLYVLVVSLIVTTGGVLTGFIVASPQVSALAPAPTIGDGGRPALTERLPAKLRTAEIYAVSSEDHYLRVHTSAGEELILLRLSDAIRELGGVDGLQTHRSWWVAKDGLADAQRDNGKLVLKLKSGAEAPVSRTYQKSVRDAGWI